MGVVCGLQCLPSEGVEETPRTKGPFLVTGEDPAPDLTLKGAQRSRCSSCCCKPKVDGDVPVTDMMDGWGNSGSSTRDAGSGPFSDAEVITPLAVQNATKSEQRDVFGVEGGFEPMGSHNDRKHSTISSPDESSLIESSRLDTSTCTTDMLYNSQGTKKLWRRPTQRLKRAMSRKKSSIIEGAEPLARISVPAAQQYARIPTSNVNVPKDYEWLQETLEAVCRQEHRGLGCQDLQTSKAFAPIFFVIGGCPNLLCGMQAIMYCVADDGEVDFWWVKPTKTTSANGTSSLELERATLNRHAKGQHKNDPGRSKQFYKPLADLFAKDAPEKDGINFGIEQVQTSSGNCGPRAFMEKEFNGQTLRMYVVSIWQEDWTTNPFARSKYIKGKLIYQKNPEASQYFARQYTIANNTLVLAHVEDPPFQCVIPGDDIKELRDYEALR